MAEPRMPSNIELEIHGLILNPSTFGSKVPKGALTRADNVVIDRPSVVATRRGFDNSFCTLYDTTANNQFQYNNVKLLHATTIAGDLHKLYADKNSDGIYTAYDGTYSEPVATAIDGSSRVRGIETNKNFYFITSDGTYRLDNALTGQPRPAGAPAGLSGSGSTTGSTGFFPNNTNIAYRVVFGFRDANQQLVLGAPSSRILLRNTSGNLANVNLTFQVPKEIQSAATNYFFQVYRGHASPDLNTEPDDEMALTYEELCSGSPSITITDITPDSLLGASLYTNQSQDGILQSNYRPPWALDVCTFKQYAFYANTRTPQTANATLISAGADFDFTITSVSGGTTLNCADTTQFSVGQTVTQGAASGTITSIVLNTSVIVTVTAGAFIAGTAHAVGNGPDALAPGDTITFTATEFSGPTFTLTASGVANNTALGQFFVSNTGNPGLDIQITASNIALVANAYASNSFLSAYYTSNTNELPGKLQFARNIRNAGILLSPLWVPSITADGFTITSSRSVCWEQPLPITSVNDSRPNRIYFSKFNQPEAVPVVNYLEVGSANQPINRIVPLRDGVMVLKQDGVFRISNAAPPFTVTPIDYNVRILAPNTAVELDNKVYFLSDQGVVALSDSDAQIMSFVLDKTIIENSSPALFPKLSAVAWGLAYQSDRKYILWMPTNGTETQPSQAYVYNHLTQVWTRWTVPATCGLIFKKDGKMYLGSESGTATDGDSYLYQERKTFTSADYVDNQYTTTNTTVNYTNTIVVNNPILPTGVTLQPGWTITQTTTGAQARILNTTVDAFTTTIVLDKSQNWAAGNIIIYTPIYSEVETVQIDCNNPGMNKQFSEIIYIFTEQGFSTLAATISSNTAGIPVTDTLVPYIRGGWGIDPWGVTPWGGVGQGQGKIRRYVPQAIQRAGWLYVNIVNAEAFTSFGWSGLDIRYKDTSTRQK